MIFILSRSLLVVTALFIDVKVKAGEIKKSFYELPSGCWQEEELSCSIKSVEKKVFSWGSGRISMGPSSAIKRNIPQGEVKLLSGEVWFFNFEGVKISLPFGVVENRENSSFFVSMKENKVQVGVLRGEVVVSTPQSDSDVRVLSAESVWLGLPKEQSAAEIGVVRVQSFEESVKKWSQFSTEERATLIRQIKMFKAEHYQRVKLHSKRNKHDAGRTPSRAYCYVHPPSPL